MANYDPFTPNAEAIAQRMLRASGGRADAAGDVVPPPPARHPQATPDPPATVAALTALRDRPFIEAAYRVVLGREADEGSAASFLEHLRSGALDKVDILGDLRYSAEGRQRAIAVDGLEWRYRLRRLGRLRGIGWLLRWIETAIRLPSLLKTARRQQAAIELASLAAEEHAAAIQELAAQLRGHKRSTAALQQSIDAAEHALDEVSTALRAVEARLEERHQQLSAANARLVTQFRDLLQRPAPLADAQPATAIATASARPAAAAAAPPPAEADQWYLAFEDQFRGARVDIKRAQEVYLAYVEAAGAGTATAPILDIGCGRGEWLELLQERACIARGVDLNQAMVAANRERGLDVIEGDVIAYVAGLPEGSLGMVTGFHLIEHLPFGLLVRLFDECLRVLRPGGCIVFETPNPENLVVSAYTFYFDPTHRNPLPPAMIEFAVRERGYRDVEILRLHPRPEPGADDLLLDKWFRGPTDYAVIGWKDRRPAAAAGTGR